MTNQTNRNPIHPQNGYQTMNNQPNKNPEARWHHRTPTLSDPLTLVYVLSSEPGTFVAVSIGRTAQDQTQTADRFAARNRVEAHFALGTAHRKGSR